MSEYPTCKCGATYDPKVGRDGGWQHRPGCVVTVCPHCGHDTAAPARSPGWPSAEQVKAAAVAAREVWMAMDHGTTWLDVAHAALLSAAPAAPASGAEWRKTVGDAMQSAWDTICSDTGCHPLDITRRGAKLFFHPQHWAEQVAELLSPSPSPPGWEEAREVAARIAESQAEFFGGRACENVCRVIAERIRSLPAPSPSGALPCGHNNRSECSASCLLPAPSPSGKE